MFRFIFIVVLLCAKYESDSSVLKFLSPVLCRVTYNCVNETSEKNWEGGVLHPCIVTLHLQVKLC